jgi:hypothetical protein
VIWKTLRCRVVGVLALATLSAGIGCAGSGATTENKADLGTEARAVFQGTAGARDASWTLLVQSLSHPTLVARADELLAQVRARGLSEARLIPSNGFLAIVIGSYSSPESPEANRDLQRVRAVLDPSGRPAFPLARLHPPTDEMLRGANPELDLRAERDRVPVGADYTLQVSVYALEVPGWPSAAQLRDFRGKAEAEAARLRGAGEEAFYVHGPSFSAVVVGVWSKDEYDPHGNPPRVAPALRDAQARLGVMRVNGRASPEGQLVTLVEVPR